MDAAHRDADGSIRLSYISFHASSGSSYRAVSRGRGVFSAALAYILDALSDFLQDRAS